MVKQEPKYVPQVTYKQDFKQTHKRRSKQKRKGASKLKHKRHAKQFRCGRIVINKQNEIQKIPLNKGGGSRFCPWFYFHMTFDEVRQKLIQLFEIKEGANEVSLYDFQLNQLDENRYRSVGGYIKSNGLSCNSTLIYIGTRENQVKAQKKTTQIDDTVPSSSLIIPKQEAKIPTLMKLDNIKREHVEVEHDRTEDIAIYTSSYE